MSSLIFDNLNFLWGLLVGIGGSLLVFKIIKNQRTSGKGTTTDQSKAKAGRDIIGRDKNG